MVVSHFLVIGGYGQRASRKQERDTDDVADPGGGCHRSSRRRDRQRVGLPGWSARIIGVKVSPARTASVSRRSPPTTKKSGAR